MTKISLWSATIYLLDVTTIRIICIFHVMSIQIIINTAREKNPWKLSRPETYLKLYRWCLKNEGKNSTSDQYHDKFLTTVQRYIYNATDAVYKQKCCVMITICEWITCFIFCFKYLLQKIGREFLLSDK